MIRRERFCIILAVSFLIIIFTSPAQAQAGNSSIEGQLRSSSPGQIMGVRVRLEFRNMSRAIADTYAGPDGRFSFTQLAAGEYVVETFETPDYAATSTSVSVQPTSPTLPMVVPVLIELRPKSRSKTGPAGVVRADVDLNVPKEASKHYHNGTKALESGDSDRAITELKTAIAAYSNYYAARLALGKELLAKNRLQEAEEILRPLKEIAPKLVEPRVNYGLVLLGLGRRTEAIDELQAAVKLEETNWMAHFFLGVAQLGTDMSGAEQNFKRALELDERKAARAHLYLAKIANAQGQKQQTIEHLNAYLNLAPNAPDADSIRKTIKKLKSN